MLGQNVLSENYYYEFKYYALFSSILKTQKLFFKLLPSQLLFFLAGCLGVLVIQHLFFTQNEISAFKTKDIIFYFFTQCEDPDYFIFKNAKCEAKVKQKENSGYTNLKNHLRSCVGKDFEDIYLDILKSCKSKGRLEAFGFIILRCILKRNLPLSEVDNVETRKTLRKYILALTPLVEEAIAKRLPIHELMVQLSQQKAAARPVKENATRWSSKFFFCGNSRTFLS